MDKQLGQTLAMNEALLGKIDVLHCPLAMIDAEFIELAHEHKLAVHAADCNTQAELEAALALRVDQLSTNELTRALAVVGGQKAI
jgi:EAL domain-containing protein (putative c-di-GMP-specific phosphodiesterase class I)